MRASWGYGLHLRFSKVSRTVLGKPAGEGESPVSESRFLLVEFQSTAGHVKPGGKLGGPPSNPKYYLMTDRGAVP